MSDYDGEVEDIEVARYGLRTFEYYPTDTPPITGLGEYYYTTSGVIITNTAPASNTRLRPVFIDAAADSWKDGTCTAECYAVSRQILDSQTRGLLGIKESREHTVPSEACGCGIYAALTMDHLDVQYPRNAKNIVAVIAAEGRTLIGDIGFRTQYARVVAYWCKRSLKSACEEQFKDAERFRRMWRMLREYNFPEPTL